MPTVLSPELEDDAEQLEGRWGIPVALEMLHERGISAREFFLLCQEADHAKASGPGPAVAWP